MSWHGAELWECLVRVPLVVYVPGVDAAPRRRTTQPHRSRADASSTLMRSRSKAGELSRPEPDRRRRSKEATHEERDVYIDMPVGPVHA